MRRSNTTTPICGQGENDAEVNEDLTPECG
jgi:hypothetical protein